MFMVSFIMKSCFGYVARDFYTALNVPICASFQQIQQAFSSISNRLKPQNVKPQNQEKAKKLMSNAKKAFEALSNPSIRNNYDLLGPQNYNNPRYFNTKKKLPVIELPLYLPLKYFFTGKNVQILALKYGLCNRCKGSGAFSKEDILQCPVCKGIHADICKRCQGAGEIILKKCSSCSGQKWVHSQTLNGSLKILAGSNQGQVHQIYNFDDQNQTSRNVRFRVHEIPNKKFRRQGFDLRYSLQITLQEAYRGFQKNIKHLDGSSRTVSKQGLTQHGDIIVLNGEGMPKGSGKGNLIVEVNIKFPKKIKSRTAVEQALSDEV